MEDERLWVLWGKQQSDELEPGEAEELQSLIETLPAAEQTRGMLDFVATLTLKPYPDDQLPEAAWQRIGDHLGDYPGDKQVAKARRLRIDYRIAAAMAAMFILVAGLVYYQFASRKGGAGTAMLNQVITQPDSKSQVELPDGTTVWLNKQSRLTYSSESFGTTHREVTLVGEAFFDVKRNEAVPFIINTNDIRIAVKGTAFNVKAYPDSKVTETSLVRGLIEITTRKDPDRKILLRPNEKFTLDRAEEEQSTVNRKDSAAFISYTVTRMKNAAGIEPAETAWMKQRLVFNGETFAELAPKLESWYNIRIVFRDQRLKEKRFSGIVEKETLEQGLRILQLSSGFRYKLTGDELVLGL